MKYLEGSIKFFIKYWILAVPLFVLIAIPALISGVGTNLAQLGSILSNISDPNSLNAGALMAIVPGILLALFGSVAAVIFQFVSWPATYGLVNKGLDTGNASLNDIGQAISQNFVKYVLYFVGKLVVGLVCGIAMVILMLICVLSISVLKVIGLLLFFIILLAVIAAGIIIRVLLSMWFAAMVVDGLKVIAAAKRSLEVAKANFWMILGITILVYIAGFIVILIFGLFSFIPVLGPIIASAVPTATAFIMMTFYMMLYRDKTGKINAM